MPDLSERFTVSGRRALVTGGSKGIGLAIAKVLADAGADVAVVGRDRSGLDEARAAIEAAGRACLVIEADMASVDGPRAAAGKALERFGTIDLLVNNAGITMSSRCSPPALRTGTRSWRSTCVRRSCPRRRWRRR